MERLTKKGQLAGNTVNYVGVDNCFDVRSVPKKFTGNAIDRLAAYEDTGLEPEEVLELRLTGSEDCRARCGSCLSFSATGYSAADEDMPELQCGYCRYWRHDTQTLDFCSKYDARR